MKNRRFNDFYPLLLSFFFRNQYKPLSLLKNVSFCYTCVTVSITFVDDKKFNSLPHWSIGIVANLISKSISQYTNNRANGFVYYDTIKKMDRVKNHGSTQLYLNEGGKNKRVIAEQDEGTKAYRHKLSDE